MQELTLEVKKRDLEGKKVKNLRKQGIIPAVINDHGKDSISVMSEYQDLYKVYEEAGRHQPFSLKADGKNYTVIIKNVTFDPIYHSITHVVFNAVKANEKITTDVPVRVRLAEGDEATPAERAGLMVLHNLTSVEIEAIPAHLPDALEFDGEKLKEVGDHATVADLIVPKGVEVKTDAAQTLASVFEPSAVAAANDAAGGAEEQEAPEAEVTESTPEA